LKVLVIGSGGREHAIACELHKSSLVDRIFWTPGNASTLDIAENPGIGAEDFDSLLKFAKDQRIDLTVVGPEVPLVRGISDLFSQNNLKVFGPNSKGAKIEGSKIFAKRLMKEKGIPTANFREFNNIESAKDFIKENEPPYVIKADGLAAGKGVKIAEEKKLAEEILTDMFENRVFGESGTRVVIEDLLCGEEATVLALCDGENVLPLISSQDHKPIYDGDKGPNTGGMGAIAPAPALNDLVMEKVIDEILLPLVHEFNKRGVDYKGIIYAGLMIKENEPWVVEFNCRFGDPEAEAVFPLLKSDLFELLMLTVNGDLKNYPIKWENAYSCDVVLVSGGYPVSYEKGKPIKGLKKLENKDGVFVFHSGTKRDGDRILTNGGRVLNIVATEKNLKDSIEKAYNNVKLINFENMFYRKDIGYRGLKHFL